MSAPEEFCFSHAIQMFALLLLLLSLFYWMNLQLHTHFQF